LHRGTGISVNENIRTEVVMAAEHMGRAGLYKGFAEQRIAEYDLNGWTVPDLINLDDVSVVMDRHALRT
jgi:4-hydroxyphenylacetate 3-monooxygenase